MILGIEIEFHVENTDITEYRTDYEINFSHQKGTSQGNIHQLNGKVVETIHRDTEGLIKVGYDATASYGRPIWHGMELTSPPLPLEETLELWRSVYRSDAKNHLNPSPDITNMAYAPPHHSCGMHVHISDEELTVDSIENTNKIISSRDNMRFVSYVAGRYDSQYCRIRGGSREYFESLFHSSTCNYRGKVDRSSISDSSFSCCRNVSDLRALSTVRGRHVALNCLPNSNTGDIEFRLFASPATLDRAAANIEFSAAITSFTVEENSDSLESFLRWLEQRESKIKYRNLFKYLRIGGYTNGLIPRIGK